MNRRSFLKVLGLMGVATAVAPSLFQTTAPAAPPSAPLYIPPQNLDMGVPRRILTATTLPATLPTTSMTWGNVFWNVEEIAYIIPIPEGVNQGEISMLLRQGEYLPGIGKLPAGSDVMVDRTIAELRIANYIAIPEPQAPREMQERSAKALAQLRIDRAASGRYWT